MRIGEKRRWRDLWKFSSSCFLFFFFKMLTKFLRKTYLRYCVIPFCLLLSTDLPSHLSCSFWSTKTWLSLIRCCLLPSSFSPHPSKTMPSSSLLSISSTWRRDRLTLSSLLFKPIFSPIILSFLVEETLFLIPFQNFEQEKIHKWIELIESRK